MNATSNIVCGKKVQIDRSGVGAAWQDIDVEETKADVVEEIAAEIEDGNKACDEYVASNGQHYRWS